MRRLVLLCSALIGLVGFVPAAEAGAAPQLVVTAGSTVVANGATASMGTTEVGTGIDLPVTIFNQVGAGDLVVTAISLVGDGGIGWHIDPVIIPPSLPTTNPGGTGYAVHPRCDAELAGDFTATLVITSNDPTNPTFSLHLTCHVDAAIVTGPPQLAVQWAATPVLDNEARVSFGTLGVGSPRSWAIVIGNHTYSEPLHVQSVTLTGDPGIEWDTDPAIDAPSYPLTVDAGTAFTVVARCTAVEIGVSEATVTIVSDDPDGTFLLHLSCTVAAEAASPAYELPTSGSAATWTSALAGLLVLLGVALRVACRRPATPA